MASNRKILRQEIKAGQCPKIGTFDNPTIMLDQCLGRIPPRRASLRVATAKQTNVNFNLIFG